MNYSFIKMNGLGNDFVVVEAGTERFLPNVQEVRAIADRKGGIGCDQLISLERSEQADAFMRIWNADGGEVGACGNAARCVGWLLMEASGRDSIRIETAAGLVEAKRAGAREVTVDMGAPGLHWRDIPLAQAVDTRRVDLEVDYIRDRPGCVSMGNPHMVFFVPDAMAVPLGRLGARLERHPLFPERANVGFAQVRAANRIRLRVWERGVGITSACGTGACAAIVAGHRRGLTGREVTVEMDGGELLIDWRRPDDHVLMTGPVAVEFAGRLPNLEQAAA
jgi:diaminopimelate epimerase